MAQECCAVGLNRIEFLSSFIGLGGFFCALRTPSLFTRRDVWGVGPLVALQNVTIFSRCSQIGKCHVGRSMLTTLTGGGVRGWIG